MSGDKADRVERGYRAASNALDERPSAATRAAILAAAARQVAAGPRDAAAPITVPRIAPMRRWPMAAAAAVLLSTLAVMMATRTEQEMPTFTPPSSVGESGAPPAAARPESTAAIAPSASPVAAADSADVKSNATTSLAKERAAAADKPPVVIADAARRSRDTVEPTAQGNDKVTVAAPTARAKDAVAEQSVPMVAAPASPPASTPPSEREAQLAAGALEPKNEAIASSELQRPAEGRRAQRADSAGVAQAPMRQAPSPALGAAAGQMRGEVDTGATVELRAEDWLEKIIKLRKSGRHDEADAELKRFRERYPQVQVPADALAPSGTR